jgi:uncharacterized protein with HEPN domain
MPRNASVLLEDVRRAAERILGATANRTESEYVTDDFLRAAVERWFIVIGEALSRLEKVDPKAALEIVAFRDIIGFRNVLVHGYDALEDGIVWQTIRVHLPVLLREVERMLGESDRV